MTYNTKAKLASLAGILTGALILIPLKLWLGYEDDYYVSLGIVALLSAWVLTRNYE